MLNKLCDCHSTHAKKCTEKADFQWHLQTDLKRGNCQHGIPSSLGGCEKGAVFPPSDQELTLLVLTPADPECLVQLKPGFVQSPDSAAERGAALEPRVDVPRLE